MLGIRTNLLRQGDGHDGSRVGYIELFFDLVFVFAITQISHGLIAHPDLPTLGETMMLGLAVWWVWWVWWVWNYTTWVMNWLDPEQWPVRAMLIVIMTLGILMASAIPNAFSDKAGLFAVTMVAIQVGRSLFTALALRRHWPDNAGNFVRITIWLATSGLFWLAGAFGPEDARVGLWLAALAIDYLGPIVRFWVPGLGASEIATWSVRGAHVAERISLFIILVLGESIIVTGSTFTELEVTPTSLFAFLAAFASTVLMWMLYFARAESNATSYISEAAETGPIARLAFTYIPVLLNTGIILTAVADELVLLHPLGHEDSGHTDLWTAGIVAGASAVYLIGNLLFRRATGGTWSLPHVAGIVALLLLPLTAPVISPLAFSWIANGVLLAVLIADDLRPGASRIPAHHASETTH